VWVLFLENLKWYEINCTGAIPRERFSHAQAIIGTQLIIFGGLNNENFCNADVYCLELDPFHSNRYSHEDKKKKNMDKKDKVMDDMP
jgi:hypothetical protein